MQLNNAIERDDKKIKNVKENLIKITGLKNNQNKKLF